MAAPVFVASEIVTAAKMNSLPKGVLGYAEVTANQTPITTEVDLTGLSVAVTVQTGRRVRISGKISIQTTVANDRIGFFIKEATTTFNAATLVLVVTGNNGTMSCPVEAVIAPTSGAHTYKLTCSRLTGTGTLTVVGAATTPNFILVEDLGGV